MFECSFSIRQVPCLDEQVTRILAGLMRVARKLSHELQEHIQAGKMPPWHTGEYIGGPFDGRIEQVETDDDEPEFIRLDREIYKHMAIRATKPGTVSVCHYLKSVPTGEENGGD